MGVNIKVAITFDDGILPSHYQTAYELHRLGIPATFYIVTHKNPWYTYLKYAKKISYMKHEIASHGANHLDLTKISNEKLLFEIEEFKKTLEEVTGSDIIGFAYPYGLYNTRVISAVSKFYEYGRTIYLRSIKTCNSVNAAENDRYSICGLCNPSPRPTFEIIRRMLNYWSNELIIVWIFHFEPLWKVLTVIKTFKSLGAEFMYVKDLINE
jgi:peptidoglycan/xylan/chitin deacetylase (PgdA/CDA1 family)